MGRLETEFDAESFHDAEHKAYRALAPSLSADLLITRAELNDEEAPDVNRHIQMNSPIATMSVEFRAFAGLYREAVNSNSPVYEFLCLFKIAEGI